MSVPEYGTSPYRSQMSVAGMVAMGNFALGWKTLQKPKRTIFCLGRPPLSIFTASLGTLQGMWKDTIGRRFCVLITSYRTGGQALRCQALSCRYRQSHPTP